MREQPPPGADTKQQRKGGGNLGKEGRLRGEAATGTGLWDVSLETRTNTWNKTQVDFIFPAIM